MDERIDMAVEKFLAGYNCAQAVVWTFSGDLGLAPDTALKLACGLGAGMARRQEVCGAVAGGTLVLGLRYGRGEGQDRLATEETYDKTQTLLRRFEDIHGTCNCRRLLGGCDITTPEGRKAYTDRDLLRSTCAHCVRTVAEILDELLAGPAERQASAETP